MFLAFPVLFSLSCGSARQSFDLPDKAVVGENGMVSARLIYPLDQKPTPECHASTIVESRGNIVAAWFGGRHERNPDVGIWVSRNEAGGWTPPVEVVNGVQDENLRYPCWNPVLFQPRQGPLMLFYKVGPNPREWWGMLVTSDNGGRTWTKPRKLGEGPLGHLLGPVKNKPVQLPDGSILCPSSTEVNSKDQGTLWKVHFELTRDLGKTWEVIGPINDGIEFDAIQPSILVHPGDKMQVLCRSRQQVIVQSWSGDGGMTWSEMTATSLPNPNAGTDALTLSDGRHLLVYNHSIRKGGFPSGREILNVAVSSNGKRWDPIFTLEKEEDGEFSYPAVIQASNGLVHISYTYLRESVKHVILDPAEF